MLNNTFDFVSKIVLACTTTCAMKVPWEFSIKWLTYPMQQRDLKFYARHGKKMC
jgi:hypothetical protein